MWLEVGADLSVMLYREQWLMTCAGFCVCLCVFVCKFGSRLGITVKEFWGEWGALVYFLLDVGCDGK